MCNSVRMEIIVKCADDKAQMAVGNSIHDQLSGNNDYVENRIVLSLEKDNSVHVFMFADSEPVNIIV